MKRGGRIIFFGETGYRSQKLVEYFEVCSPRACNCVPDLVAGQRCCAYASWQP